MDAATVALGGVLLTLGALATKVDVERRIIPNRLTGAGALLALVLGCALDPAGEPERLVAGAGAAGFLLLAALIDPAAMGMGDVKLAGAIGLCLGGAVVVALVAAFTAGALYGLAILATRGLRAYRTATLPFGPCLALGGAIGLAAGLL